MSDDKYALDPLLATGPEPPRPNFRPGVRPQRMLILDDATPTMFDISRDEYAPWQNGIPTALPFISAPIAIDDFAFVMIQVERDVQALNEDGVLVSWRVGDHAIEVIETADHELVIARNSGAGRSDSVSGSIGGSPAIVTMFEPGPNQGEVVLSARNAETMTAISLTVETGLTSDARRAAVTVGGPTAELTGSFGRRRAGSVHLDAQRGDDGQLARAGSGLRRVAGRVRDRL